MEDRFKHTKKFQKSTLDCEINSHTSLLPDYFNSDLSANDDFWGFPSNAAELNISSACVIQYSMSQRDELLFHGDLYDEEFHGFTRKEISQAIISPTTYLRQHPKHKGKSNTYEEDISAEDEYLCKSTLQEKPLIRFSYTQFCHNYSHYFYTVSYYC